MADRKSVLYTSVDKIGTKIWFRGYDIETGTRITANHVYSPTIYVLDRTVEPGPGDFVTLDGRKVAPVETENMWECMEFIKKYQGVDGFEMFGNTNFTTQWISDYYQGTDLSNSIALPNMKLVRRGILDIETESESGFPNPETASERINLITIKHNGKHHSFGLNTEIDFSDRDDVIYFGYDNESQMLSDFVEYFSKTLDLDVVTSWNGDFFDIPYLVNRIQKLLGDDAIRALSPNGKVRAKTLQYFGQDRQAYDISGISFLDYQRLYQKYRLIPRESYKLDYIGEVELKLPKLEWKSQYGSMKEFYTKNFKMFAEYNFRDIDIVEGLDKKLKLLELIISIAYYAGINYEDVFSQVRTWDAIIYNHLRKKNIVIPIKDSDKKLRQYEGAYVKEPIVGLHQWILSFDLASLYPHLILQYQISPEKHITRKVLEAARARESDPQKQAAMDVLLSYPNPKLDYTIDDYLEKKSGKFQDAAKVLGYSVAANGCLFDNNNGKGFLCELMDMLYAERSSAKKKMLKTDREIEDIISELKRRGEPA